jgi:hypothetical protein
MGHFYGILSVIGWSWALIVLIAYVIVSRRSRVKTK